MPGTSDRQGLPGKIIAPSRNGRRKHRRYGCSGCWRQHGPSDGLSGGDAARPASPEKIKLSRDEIALRWLAVILATWALAETAIHLVTPHFAVSNTTLSIARKFLVQPKERADLEYLVAQPFWHGEKLQTLLTHVELAGYNRELINWQLDDKVYRDFVLSPVITGRSGEQLNWRRPLWEEFYPRIRHESSPEEAAKIVVRHLRERVTIATLPDSPHGVPEIWLKQITDKLVLKSFMLPRSVPSVCRHGWIRTNGPSFGTAKSGTLPHRHQSSVGRKLYRQRGRMAGHGYDSSCRL